MKPLQFLSPIHRASRQIEIYLEQCCKQYELSTTEAHLISYLYAYAPCAIADLNRVFGYKYSTLTSILDRLVARQLILRESHPEDRRSFLLELTSTGKDLAKQIRKNIEKFEQNISQLLSKEELHGFDQVIKAIENVAQSTTRKI